VRFLIDECLTVELVREAEKAGFEAHHVAHLGKASTKDWAIRDYAIEGGFVLVTNNAADFQALYADTDLHSGLVILVPNVALNKQVLLFRAALKGFHNLAR
jgi:predicted nuclease of predicted toxin-antitoxin system